MWVTGPQIDKIKQLFLHWNFQYQTVLHVWRKLYQNNQSKNFRYTIPECEFLVLGTKGTVDSTCKLPQLFQSFVQSHSSKPNYFYYSLNETFKIELNQLTCLELFATKTHKIFDSYGNNIPDYFQRSPLTVQYSKSFNVTSFKDTFYDWCNVQKDKLTSLQIQQPIITQFLQYMYQNQNIFAQHDFDLGSVSLVKHSINLKPNSVPKLRNYYKISDRQSVFLKDMIDNLLSNNVIRRSQSNWASPIVLPKKGDSFRFCVNYEELNAATIPNQYPLPIIDDLLFSLSGSKYFSKIDMKNGYWQIQMQSSDIHKTAFTCKYGLFEWTTMPQGLRNAPATFQSLVDQIFQEYIGKFVYCYIDDILIFSKSITEHFEHLYLVFQKLVQINLKLSLKKCEFFQTKLKILGHVVEDGSIAPDPEKIQSIQEIQRPRTVRQIQSFLGLTNYYRKFIQHYAKIAKPLQTIGFKTQKYSWNLEQEHCFNELKQCLQSHPVLQLPDFSKPFFVYTDFSALAIAGILSQKDDNGNEFVVQYASKTCNNVESNMPSYEGEMLAVVFSLQKFRQFILESKFFLITDNIAVKWLFTNDKINRKLQRWRVELQEFDFTVIHKRGKTHTNVDALSRLCTAVDSQNVSNVNYVTESEVSHTQCNICKLQDEQNMYICDYCAKGFHSTCYNIDTSKLYFYCNDCLRIVQKQKHTDPTFDLILINYLQNGSIDAAVTESHIKDIAQKYTIQNNQLYLIKNNKQLFIPSFAERTQILHNVHVEMLNHTGINKTYIFMRDKYFWPNMLTDIKNFVHNCFACQNQNVKFHKHEKFIPTYKGSRPSQVWALDIITNLQTNSQDVVELPRTVHNNKHILVAVDMFSKWIEAWPLPDKSSQSVLDVFYKDIVCRFGLPDRVRTDKGLEFFGVFSKFLDDNNVNHDFAPSTYPQANGMVERMNQTFLKLLRKCIISTVNVQWDELIPSILQSIRYIEATSTALLPFYVMFGRQPRLPFQSVQLFDAKQKYVDQFLREFVKHQENNDKFVHKQLLAQDQKNIKNYKIPEKQHQFAVQQLVLLKKLRKKKLDPKAHGPFQIISFKNSNTVVVKNLRTQELTDQVLANLAPLYSDTDTDNQLGQN